MASMASGVKYFSDHKCSVKWFPKCFNGNDIAVFGQEAGMLTITGIAERSILRQAEAVRLDKRLSAEEKLEKGQKVLSPLFNRILLPLGKRLQSVDAPQGYLRMAIDAEEGIVQFYSNKGPLVLHAGITTLETSMFELTQMLHKEKLDELLLFPGQKLFLTDARYDDVVKGQVPVKYKIPGYGLNIVAPRGDIVYQPGKVGNQDALVISCDFSLCIQLRKTDEKELEIPDDLPDLIDEVDV